MYFITPDTLMGRNVYPRTVRDIAPELRPAQISPHEYERYLTFDEYVHRMTIRGIPAQKAREEYESLLRMGNMLRARGHFDNYRTHGEPSIDPYKFNLIGATYLKDKERERDNNNILLLCPL